MEGGWEGKICRDGIRPFKPFSSEKKRRVTATTITANEAKCKKESHDDIIDNQQHRQ